MNDHDLLTEAQAARALLVSVTTLRRWTDGGYIQVEHTSDDGGRWYAKAEIDGQSDRADALRTEPYGGFTLRWTEVLADDGRIVHSWVHAYATPDSSARVFVVRLDAHKDDVRLQGDDPIASAGRETRRMARHLIDANRFTQKKLYTVRLDRGGDAQVDISDLDDSQN